MIIKDSFVSDGKSKTSGKMIPIGTFDLPTAASQIGESLREYSILLLMSPNIWICII